MPNNSKEVQPPILEEEAILPPADAISSPCCLETSAGALLPDVTAKLYEKRVFFHVQKLVVFLEVTLQLEIYYNLRFKCLHPHPPKENFLLH